MEKENKVVILIIGIILITILGYYYLSKPKSIEDTIKVDTINQDITTNLEDDTLSWNILNDSKTGFEVKYPDDFFDEGHQPRVLIGECNYELFPNVCPNIDNIIDGIPANTKSENIIINQVNYCLQNYQDAAMGQVHSYRYYTTVIDNSCAVIPIETSQTNCDFYLPLEEGNTEQKTNYDNCISKNEDQPIILDKIISSFKFEQ